MPARNIGNDWRKQGGVNTYQPSVNHRSWAYDKSAARYESNYMETGACERNGDRAAADVAICI